MAVKRVAKQLEAVFQVGLNVILKGSKKMNADEQDRLMGVGQVRFIIVDATDDVIVKPGANVLVDETLDAVLFRTGSVGYMLHRKDVEFSGGAK